MYTEQPDACLFTVQNSIVFAAMHLFFTAEDLEPAFNSVHVTTLISDQRANSEHFFFCFFTQ